MWHFLGYNVQLVVRVVEIWKLGIVVSTNPTPCQFAVCSVQLTVQCAVCSFQFSVFSFYCWGWGRFLWKTGQPSILEKLSQWCQLLESALQPGTVQEDCLMTNTSNTRTAQICFIPVVTSSSTKVYNHS